MPMSFRRRGPLANGQRFVGNVLFPGLSLDRWTVLGSTLWPKVILTQCRHIKNICICMHTYEYIELQPNSKYG